MVNTMACKEICLFHKAKSTGKNRYSNNQKRCQICEIFIKWVRFLLQGRELGALVVDIC